MSVHQGGGQGQWHQENRHRNCQPTKSFVQPQVSGLDQENLKSDESEPENEERGMNMQDEGWRRRLAQIAGEVQAEPGEYCGPDHSDPDYVDSSVAYR